MSFQHSPRRQPTSRPTTSRRAGTPAPRRSCPSPLATLAPWMLLIVLAATAPAAATDLWSKFRGPDADGLHAEDLLPDEEFGLRVEWRVPVGSGYSGISAAGGRLFTLHARDEVDVVAAFDADTGRELWTHELGPRYQGHTGSDDGPLSTPTVADGVAFAVGPRGQVVALDAETGARRWLVELDESNSTVPFYGYTTSPLVVGDTVLLATGGEGHALTALDRATGEQRWTAGSGDVFYQTPTRMRLGDRDAVVLSTNQELLAFDLEDGTELWRLRHTEGNQTDESTHLTLLGDGRFLVNHQQGARLYRADADSVEELWRTRAFANSLALPVHEGGHLYGFTRGILTCVDAATGEIVWRSREPGGQALTRIDGRLATVAPDGSLVVFAPDPSGYRELTRVGALEGDASTHAPSFADGSFLVRNLREMASVAVDVDAAPSAGPVEVTDRLLGDFGRWIGELEALPVDRRQQAVDRRWEQVESTPLFEPEGGDPSLVHFVWRGGATDVALGGDPVSNQEEAMERIEGTDLFFRSLELHPAAQYNYTLSVDFANPVADPANPHTVDQGFAVVSDLRMPDWPASPHLDEPADDAPRGSLDSFPFRSIALGNTRQIQVWRPPTYATDPEARFPLLVVHHGDNLVRGSLMTRTLDNLVGRSVAPLVAVFVPRVAPPEYGGEQADAHNRFLVDELLPHLRRHYRVEDSGYTAMGPGSAGVASLYAALSHPDLFSAVAVQSYYPIDPAQERIVGILEADDDDGASAPLTRAVVVTSNRDYPPALTGSTDAQSASVALVESLRAAGVDTELLVSEYTPGWGGWRGQHDDILEALFPLAEVDPSGGAAADGS